MKLEGSLDAFSLPDVFQLLSLTKKSGGLHLTNGQASGVVYFADGSVTGAISDISRQALARRLVGLGAADDAALRRAVERGASEGAGVARALLEAGGVDSALVQRLALEQAVDAVFDLLRWPNGDFAFGMGEENPDDVGLAVSAEKVVADATARRDSWESLSRLIPSPEVVLTMPVVQPEGAASIAPDEWALLSLIDGERTVGVLVDVSGAGQFTVVSTLASLVQRGLLVLRDEDGPDHVTLVRRRQQLLAPLEGGTAAAGDQSTSPAPANPAQVPIVPGANVPATAGGPATPQSPGGESDPTCGTGAASRTDVPDAGRGGRACQRTRCSTRCARPSQRCAATPRAVHAQARRRPPRTWASTWLCRSGDNRCQRWRIGCGGAGFGWSQCWNSRPRGQRESVRVRSADERGSNWNGGCGDGCRTGKRSSNRT